MRTATSFLAGLGLALTLTICAGQLRAEVKIYNPENYPDPVPLTGKAFDQLGQMIPRTMHLLETSEPGNRKKVKIAIYGQSLNDDNNTWWRDLRAALQCTYPYTDVEVICLGVGGFSTATLWRTTYADIAAYYPDLVILCVAGHHTYYESIIRFIRGCTTAEIIIQNDPIGGKTGDGEGCAWDADLNDMSDWGNKMSFLFLPEFCEKYGLQLNNRKQEWYDYLKANCYIPTSGTLLQADGGHMSTQGQYLTAALVARHFRYDPAANPDPYKMVTVYKPGTDVAITGNTIKMSISGNRIDIITADTKGGKETLQLLIDGKKPSSFAGCYKNTRTIMYDSYWNGGAVQTLGTSPDLQEEEWKIDIDDNGIFTLTGSKTGFDGKGNVEEYFESNSGRIVIREKDWFKGGSELKDRSFTFYTKCYAKDDYILPAHQIRVEENIVTLAQGIPNGTHDITLTGAVDKIKEIRVYRPPYQLTLDADKSALNFEKEGGVQQIAISTNTYRQVYNRTPWINIDAVDNNTGEELLDNQTITITAEKNNTPNPRTATIMLTGIGVEPFVLTVSQSK